MSRRHYQYIVLGDSLASRLAAVLLAKGGARVLTFEGGTPTSPFWFHSSRHLERILESLDGHSCFAPPVPFQVISPTHRLECHGATPLEEELRREFPREHELVAGLLEQLATLGERLEERLWKKGRFPLRPNLRFGLQDLFVRPSAKKLRSPLSSLLAPLSPTGSGAILRALFSGMTLLPVERLSVAEGALLWSDICRPRSVSPSGLDALLRHRYEQFHGETEQLADIKELVTKGSRLLEVVLQNDGRCGGESCIIGTPLILPQLPSAARRRCPVPSPALHSLTLSVQADQVSSLLASRIILAGDPPLRISLTHRENQIVGNIDLAGAGNGELPALATIRARLRLIFPFADIHLASPEPQDHKETEAAQRRGFLGATGRLRAGGNLLYCHGASLLPSLGASAEVFAGHAVVRMLQRRKGLILPEKRVAIPREPC